MWVVPRAGEGRGLPGRGRAGIQERTGGRPSVLLLLCVCASAECGNATRASSRRDNAKCAPKPSRLQRQRRLRSSGSRSRLAGTATAAAQASGSSPCS